MAQGKGFANVVVTLDATTRRIEQGLLYTGIANVQMLASAASLSLLVRTPPTPLSPMIFEYVYGGAATLQLFEGATVSADGTPIVPVNHRRIPPVRAPDTLLFQNPTVTDDGTPLIPAISLPGGTSGKNTAGGSDETLFWVLAPATDYLVRLVNDSTQSESMTIIANFAELLGPLSSGT